MNKLQNLDLDALVFGLIAAALWGIALWRGDAGWAIPAIAFTYVAVADR